MPDSIEAAAAAEPAAAGTAAAAGDPRTSIEAAGLTTGSAAAGTPATLDPAIWRALGHGHTIDITTTGRRTGQPRRVEIVFHNFGGRLYISGTPNPDRERAWLLNLRADPNLTFHLKQVVTADLHAIAREITDVAERREVLEKVARVWRRDPEPMLTWSPLIEVVIDGYGVADPQYKGPPQA